MRIINHKELVSRLNSKSGKIEILCVEAPITVPNGVSGEWHLFFIPNGSQEKMPLVTSGVNPRIRIARKLHGLFTLMAGLNISPIVIPIVPNESSILEPVSTILNT
jgi:hypothetical protein